MLAAHYATAMVAYQKYPNGTLLYFLIASQLQDFLWFAFHYLGLEVTTPEDVFDTTVSNMAVDMLYSHDLIPLSVWLLIIFLIGKVLFKDTKIALTGTLLVLGHFVLDFFSGHPHHIFGIDSPQVGLGNYASNTFTAIAIEIVATIMILSYFFNQEVKSKIIRTKKNKYSIIGLFVFGNLFMLSIAITPFREILNIPQFDVGFNTSVPTLIFTYIGMLLYLNYFVPKYNKVA